MAIASQIIAIVDDDSSVLRALQRLLSARSWVTKVFLSGSQFLASLDAELPGCLILDLQMPEMSGLEVLKTLVSRGIEIPTIIITSNKDAAMRERCMAAGAVAYLLKPVRRQDLFNAINAARAASGP
jgi:FixJ family two-component response regulator